MDVERALTRMGRGVPFRFFPVPVFPVPFLYPFRVTTLGVFEFSFSCGLDHHSSFGSAADLISVRVLVQLLT